MAYECAHCGKLHAELPRYFMCREPQTKAGRVIDAAHEQKSMCRTQKRFFVRCEIEIPLSGADGPPLGFICWVEIKRKDYESLLDRRQQDATSTAPSTYLSGRLANPVHGVPNSYGTDVRFEVLQSDPTPYIRWIAPRSQLAARVKSGASMAFWHQLAFTQKKTG